MFWDSGMGVCGWGLVSGALGGFNLELHTQSLERISGLEFVTDPQSLMGTGALAAGSGSRISGLKGCRGWDCGRNPKLRCCVAVVLSQDISVEVWELGVYWEEGGLGKWGGTREEAETLGVPLVNNWWALGVRVSAFWIGSHPPPPLPV